MSLLPTFFTTPEPELRWLDAPALNPYSGPVWRLPDGRLVQLGHRSRIRAHRTAWGGRDIVTLLVYDPSGHALLSTEVTSPAKFNALRLPRVPMS